MTTKIAKHTPGPWKYKVVDFGDHTPAEHFISAENRGRICRISSPDEEGVGNAHLIAAAPAQNNSLQEILSIAEEVPDEDKEAALSRIREIARAAIAKAESA